MPELIISGGGGAAAALQTVSSILGADVAMAANTDTLITSVSLPAGTWLVLGQLAVIASVSTGTVAAALKVSAGAILSSAEDFYAIANATAYIQLSPMAIVTLAATTTVELRAEAGMAATAKAAAGLGYLTNVATQILAVKLG